MALVHIDHRTLPVQSPTRIEAVEVRFAEGTVAQLIKCAVEEQVRDLAVRRQLTPRAVRQALDSQYRDRLPDPRILRNLEWQKINMRQEVRTALRSFEEGIFTIMIDGQAVPRSLEALLQLTPTSRVTFRRQNPMLVA
jgi:hypothetical protein